MADTTTTTSVPTSADRVQQINNMYDANLASTKANLESSYQSSLSDAQSNADKIDTTYGEQKNQLAAEYERQRRNNNISAQVSGLNSGAGSQMALAQQANYQSNQAAVAKAQAQAHVDADKAMQDLKTQYQLQVNEAVANNDYQRATALLDEYNNQYSQAVAQAQAQAQYGDFSGYANVYGQTAADNMANYWNKTEAEREEDRAYEKAQTERSNAVTDAATKAQYGDFSGYSSLYGDSSAQTMQDYWNKLQTESDEDRADTKAETTRTNSLEDAQLKAQYGDFSGFASLYGEETAKAMEQAWLLQNPALAYTMGKITAEQYYKMTGSYPVA